MVVAFLLAGAGLTPVDPDSPNTKRIEDLYWFIGFWAAIVGLSVAIPLILFTIRYRSRGRPRTVEGPQVHGSTRLEIAWTAVPVLILLIVVGFTFYKLPGITLEAAAGEDVTKIRVEGRQFYWQYRYPNGALAIDKLRAPADRLVELQITAPDTDVIHSYWAPDLFPKIDAIPGKVNTTRFRGKPGTYRGQCVEFCGIQHAAMLSEIELVDPEEFDSWVTKEAQEQETRDSDLGKQVFEGVCAKCHGPQGQGLIGPGLTAATVSNASLVADIVRHGRGKMPDVGAGWDDRQMRALTDYLKERFQAGTSGS
ncbi:MAG TPA: cytochrome c oxidase subunit II [Gaiellaceae bacterium]|nr:cytochrome c oxidase subunit II [Gaiellaceae bacterium]